MKRVPDTKRAERVPEPDPKQPRDHMSFLWDHNKDAIPELEKCKELIIELERDNTILQEKLTTANDRIEVLTDMMESIPRIGDCSNSERCKRDKANLQEKLTAANDSIMVLTDVLEEINRFGDWSHSERCKMQEELAKTKKKLKASKEDLAMIWADYPEPLGPDFPDSDYEQRRHNIWLEEAKKKLVAAEAERGKKTRKCSTHAENMDNSVEDMAEAIPDGWYLDGSGWKPNVKIIDDALETKANLAKTEAKLAENNKHREE
jgi:hypothetical protein